MGSTTDELQAMADRRGAGGFLRDFPPLKALDPLMEHLEILGAPVVEGEWWLFKVRLKPFHMNGSNTAHGGLIMTLLDVAMACSSLSDEANSCVTIEMKTNFMRPAGVVGAVLLARGRKRSGGKSLAFCEGEILSESGKLLATGSGTFKYLARNP